MTYIPVQTDEIVFQTRIEKGVHMNRRVFQHFATVTISLLLISAVALAQTTTTPSKTTTAGGTQKSSTSTTSKTGTTTTAKSTTPAKKKLDINSATKKELMELPGIGDALSQKIIDGRPYKAKNELTQKKILTDDAYTKITDLIIATQPKATTTSAGSAAKTSTSTTAKAPASTSTTTKGK